MKIRDDGFVVDLSLVTPFLGRFAIPFFFVAVFSFVEYYSIKFLMVLCFSIRRF